MWHVCVGDMSRGYECNNGTPLQIINGGCVKFISHFDMAPIFSFLSPYAFLGF